MGAPSAILREWNFKARLFGLCVNRRGDIAAALLDGGVVALLRAEDSGEEPFLLPVAEAGLRTIVPDVDEHAFLAVGSEGSLFIVEEALASPTLIAQEKGMVAAAALAAGERAYACGRDVRILDENGSIRLSLQARGTINALGFCRDTGFLAVAHDKGISLLGLAQSEQKEILLPAPCGALFWAPGGTALLATGVTGGAWLCPAEKEPITLALPEVEKENVLRPCAVTAAGQYLALAGGRQGLLLDRSAKIRALGGIDARRVTQIAPHPTEPFVAVGYDDGLIVFSPLDGRTDILVHAPVAPQGSGVVGLAWSGAGDVLLAALESGWLMLLTQKSVQAAVRARLGH